MIYIYMDNDTTAYVFSDKVKSFVHNAEERIVKVYYADGEEVTYKNVLVVTIKAE